jgi:streptomycin 6-kinase
VSKALNDRIVERARAWGVTIGRASATETSVLVYGQRAGKPVVIKLAKRAGDEWRSGEIAAAFGGRGVVQVYEQVGGAALLEHVQPGEQLASLAAAGRDDEATDILATLLGRMSPGDAPTGCPTVDEWGAAFANYLGTGDERVPRALVEPAQRIYAELCVTQRNPALLHGDLQHYNVLRDDKRGWLAVDPKGVIGELEYELGAMLRNPRGQPSLYTLAAVERRLERFGAALGLDIERARAWGFAQAVLSAIWLTEDGHELRADEPSLLLARALEQSPALRADFLEK